MSVTFLLSIKRCCFIDPSWKIHLLAPAEGGQSTGSTVERRLWRIWARLLFAHHSDKSPLVIQYHFIVTPELTLNLEQPVNETHAGRGWRCNTHKERVQLTQRFEPAPEQLLAVHWFNTINIMHAYWFSSDSDHCVITKRLNLSWLCLGNSKDSVKLMERLWTSAFSLLTKGHSGHNPDCSFPKIWKMKRKINVEDSSWFHYIAFPDKLLSKSMDGGLGWWYLIAKCRNS